MKQEIPQFLIEMSEQMNAQDNRITAEPIWEVRYKKYIPTEQGYDDHHFVIVDDEGEIYRSDKSIDEYFADYMLDNHEEWLSSYMLSEHEISNDEDVDIREEFINQLEFLPRG